jgi:hypothetical protein
MTAHVPSSCCALYLPAYASVLMLLSGCGTLGLRSVAPEWEDDRVATAVGLNALYPAHACQWARNALPENHHFWDFPVSYTSMRMDLPDSRIEEYGIGIAFFKAHKAFPGFRMKYVGIGLASVDAKYIDIEAGSLGGYVHVGVALWTPEVPLPVTNTIELRYTFGTDLTFPGAPGNAPTNTNGVQVLLGIGVLF